MDFPWQSAGALSLALVASLPGLTRAEPLVSVRAESRIEIGVTHEEHETVVEGALRDELGNPLPGRSLEIAAGTVDGPSDDGLQARLQTDLDGHFAFELPEADQDYRLVAKFEGDATHRGVRVERRIERTRADVRLELRLAGGSDIDLDQSSLAVQLIAESDAGGEGIVLRLLDGHGRELGRGKSDAQGRLTLSIPSAALGEPGPGVLRVESLRDERRAEAQTEAHILRRRRVRLTLWPASAELAAGDAIEVAGRVTTQAGPRSQVPVGLFIAERHMATVISDEQGRFAATLWRDSPPQTLEVRARTEADLAGAYPEAEARTLVTLLAPQPLPLGWMLGALVLVLGPLLALTARPRVERDARPVGGAPPTRTSIHPARAHGRRDRHRINGRALDALTEIPLVHAEVRLEQASPPASSILRTDADGRFASGILPAGTVKVVVRAQGYVASEIELTIPHRGEWSSFVVRLLSLRELSIAPFRRIASRLLPSERAWGVWTTRETRDYLARQHTTARQAITELAGEVERACYSEAGPSEADVRKIEADAAELEQGLGGESASQNTSLR